jgi:hypothetical protein
MAKIKKETLEVLKNNLKAVQLSPSDSLNVYIGVADKFKNKTQEENDKEALDNQERGEEDARQDRLGEDRQHGQKNRQEHGSPPGCSPVSRHERHREGSCEGCSCDRFGREKGEEASRYQEEGSEIGLEPICSDTKAPFFPRWTKGAFSLSPQQNLEVNAGCWGAQKIGDGSELYSLPLDSIPSKVAPINDSSKNN